MSKKGLIIGGSIAAVVLIGAAVGIGIAASGSKVENTPSSNDYGIGAFSNLESFDNDGFNNGVKKAGEAYLNGYDGNDEYFVNKDKKKLELQTSTYSDDGKVYVDMIESYFATNDIIISAGFQVGGALKGVATDTEAGVEGWDGVFTKKDGTDTAFANSTDKAFVLLDDSELPTLYSNTASVSFAAEGAGYLSSVLAYIYTEYDAITNGKDTANIVMWGGMPFPTVYDYMSGFAQGITNLSDTYVGTTLEGGQTLVDVTLWSGGDTTDSTISETNKYGGSTADANSWYTFGFDANTSSDDGKLAEAKTQNAIDAGASIVFPIAGGNTTVAEETIIKGGAGVTTKLLGVDSDATLASSHDDLYIASAQKNLEKGGAIGLWGMDDYDNDGVRNFEETEVAEGDTVGTYITENEASWNVSDDTTLGLQLRGTLDNGGAGVIYGDDTAAGMNADLEAAFTWLGLTDEDVSTILASIVESSPTIEAADDAFIPAEWA